MQIAKALLALGGDVGNTIQKYDVTPSEVMLLRALHGNESVTEISIYGDVGRTSRAERERLIREYGRAQPGTDQLVCAPLENLFPGIAARMFEKFDEIRDLEDAPENFFKDAPQPADAAPAAEVAPAPVLGKMTKAQLLTMAAQMGVEVSENDTKAEIIEAIEAAQPDDDDGGGIGSIPDNMFQ